MGPTASGTTTSFIILGDWTELLLPLGAVLFAGVLAMVLLSVRRHKS